jgi:hypothetical protein
MIRVVGLMVIFIISAVVMIPVFIWRHLRAKGSIGPVEIR